MTNNLSVVTEAEGADIVALARARAKAWLKGEGRSQGDIAGGTTYSRATINLFLTENYEAGDQSAVARAILNFLDRQAREAEVSVTLHPVETPAYRAVHSALDIAKYTRRIAVIYGKPGSGKTFPAVEYAKLDPRHNLVLWTRYGVGTPKGFCAELIRLLKGEQELRYQYASRMSGDVLDLLRKNPRFIIVNDAHRLRFPIFELACDIVEQANVGIAFIGHEMLKDTLTKLQRHDSEVYDRVLDFANLTRITHYDEKDEKGKPIWPVADVHAIHDVAAQILPGLTDDAALCLADRAVFPSMRSVVNTCLVARSIQARVKKNQAADAALIKQAYKLRRPEA